MSLKWQLLVCASVAKPEAWTKHSFFSPMDPYLYNVIKEYEGLASSYLKNNF